MKALKYAIALLLALAVLTVPAWAIDLEPGTGSGFYVQDSANVLSSATEQAVAQYNAVLENDCDGAQLVVATVNYLDEDSDVAATRLMNDWGVGNSSQSNGMLLLLVAKEARGWLAVGQGLDRTFTDDMCERYLDKYLWKDVDAGRFDDGVQALTEALYEWYLDEYGVDAAGQTYYEPESYYGTNSYSGYDPYYYNDPAPSRSGGIVSVIVALLFILLILWIVGAASRFTRMRRWGYSGGFFPIFWFGGRRRYRSYRDQFRPPPPPGPGPGPRGPAGFGGGGFMGGGFGASRPRRTSSFSRPSAPRSSGGFRSGGSFRSGGGSFRSGGGGFHGGGFGGHSGGGGGGRR